MIELILQMSFVMLLGVAWRIWKPAGLDGDRLRHALTNLVYYLLLPALVLQVLWTANLDTRVLSISLVALSGALLAMLLTWVSCRLCGMPRAVIGAALLAASFPNATYMGLPVLESLFGDLGRQVAVQYDFFALTPLLLSLGVFVAQHYGDAQGYRVHPLKNLLRVPPLWAAFLAVLFQLLGVPKPQWVDGVLGLLSVSVVPLMLFSLGLALTWRGWRWSNASALLPIVAMQLLITPTWVYFAGGVMGLDGDWLMAVVLEAAMPSMVLGIVFCDRFGLNTGLYAVAVSVTTGLSLLMLPFWHAWLSGTLN